MKTTLASLFAAAALLVVPCLLGQRQARGQAPAPVLASLELTGPYVYQNLAIFAVHDKHAAKHDEILTLQRRILKFLRQ